MDKINRKVNSFWGNIFQSENGQYPRITDILKNIPIFSELTRSELKEVEQIIHQRYFKAQETIFWEGEPGMGMYMIQQGEVGIYRNTENGEQEELAQLKSGDFFGDIALLGEFPRSATAIALKDSYILGLFRPDLFRLFERNPRLGLKVLLKLANLIASRLQRTDEELQLLRTKLSKSEIIV
ncbi:MAG: cyclic nucleotide-binding domain-containing protein [candidate division KSB1 bacterium]|nr:cyclic nucleotide-binding domain-containing protein [candidate division KSB1 bacterium]